VIRNRLGRFTTVLTAASMALLLLGVGAATAKTPSGWGIAVQKLPPTVAAGNDAGYSVTVSNAGPSNVNAVTLTVVTTDTPGADPTYFSGLTWNVGGPGSCEETGGLVCDLGTIAAGTSIQFVVAYNVPAGTTGAFDVTFSLESASGNTGRDQGGNSRGDSYNKTFSTGISSNQNFDAGFVVDQFTYETTGSLGRSNKQTTKVEVTDDLIPVTVEDGINSYPCDGCSNLIGEWSVLNVAGGATGEPIKVTIFIYGGAVPGGVQAGDIYLYHADGDGGWNIVDATCDASPPNNADCLESVTKIGQNYKIVAWLEHNGGMRGAY